KATARRSRPLALDSEQGLSDLRPRASMQPLQHGHRHAWRECREVGSRRLLPQELAVTNTVVRYEPRGGARQLMLCRDAEALICGPAGTGKSLAMLFKLHLTCLSVPGTRALLVRQTHASLTGTTLVTFEKAV